MTDQTSIGDWSPSLDPDIGPSIQELIVAIRDDRSKDYLDRAWEAIELIALRLDEMRGIQVHIPPRAVFDERYPE